MSDIELFDGKSCALFLTDSQQVGLEASRIITGTLLSDSEDLYFQKDSKEGFPLPREWYQKLFLTPPERSEMFMGCTYFIALERTNERRPSECLSSST